MKRKLRAIIGNEINRQLFKSWHSLKFSLNIIIHKLIFILQRISHQFFSKELTQIFEKFIFAQ
jgi:hypothetical protein